MGLWQSVDRGVRDSFRRDVPANSRRGAAGHVPVSADDVFDRGGNVKLLHSVLWYYEVSFGEIGKRRRT